MDFFMVDTVGDHSRGRPKKQKKPLLPKTSISVIEATRSSASVEPKVTVKKAEPEDDDEDDDYGGLPPPSKSIADILSKDVFDMSSVYDHKKKIGRQSKFFADTTESTSKGVRIARAVTKENELNQTDVEAEMKNAVLTPNIERKEDIARLAMSDKKLQKLNREERNRNKGRNWFNMAAPEMTPEVKNELELIKMRSVLDPKKTFGRVEKRKMPKYFEIGTVVESPLDHFNERGIKKVKKQTLVEELLADAQFQKYNKRKYVEALEKKKKRVYVKAIMKMKKEKKKRR